MKSMTADHTMNRSMVAANDHTVNQSRPRAPELEYRLIHALAFVTFLVAGSVWYVLSLGFLRSGENAPQSPISMARTAADSVPFVFQGH